MAVLHGIYSAICEGEWWGHHEPRAQRPQAAKGFHPIARLREERPVKRIHATALADAIPRVMLPALACFLHGGCWPKNNFSKSQNYYSEHDSNRVRCGPYLIPSGTAERESQTGHRERESDRCKWLKCAEIRMLLIRKAISY